MEQLVLGVLQEAVPVIQGLVYQRPAVVPVEVQVAVRLFIISVMVTKLYLVVTIVLLWIGFAAVKKQLQPQPVQLQQLHFLQQDAVNM